MSFFSVSVNAFLLKPSDVVGMLILVTPYIQLYLGCPYLTRQVGVWSFPNSHCPWLRFLTIKRDVSCFPSLKHVLPNISVSMVSPPWFLGSRFLVVEVAEAAVTSAPELVEVGCGGVSWPARRWCFPPGESWTLWMAEISDCCLMTF